MDYRSALDYLFALESRGIKLDLDRMRGALRALGSPERSFRSILVAGTNGKGSTSALMASVLSRAGRPVGLYTSPHLLDYRERIRLDGRMIPADDVAQIVARDRGVWESHELSFFEATTAMAFTWFRERRVDLAVLEVGLGGRLDATNTVEPILSVITRLGMDHSAILGDTPAKIAREKAGILRPGVPLAFAGGPGAAVAQIRSSAAEIGAPLHIRRDVVRVERMAPRPGGAGTRFTLRPAPGAALSLPLAGLELETPLAGRHQVGNAANAVVALLLLRRAGIGWEDRELDRGLARLVWPGRLERPRTDLPLLADAAHNREGARAVADALSRASERRPIRLVAGMVAGKDHEGFFREMARITRRAWIAAPPTHRAASLEDLARAARGAGLEVQVFPTITAALRDALLGIDKEGGETVLLAGSFYTLEEGYRALDVEPKERLWTET